MTITQFGRVELDPNRVPIPASAQRDSEPSFRERLDTVTQQRAQEPVSQAQAPVKQDHESTGRDDAEPSTVAGDTRETETREPAERLQPLASRAPGEPSVATALKPNIGPNGTSRAGEARNSSQSGGIDPVLANAQGLASSPARLVSSALHAAPTPVVHGPGQGKAQATAMIEQTTAQKALVKATKTQPGYRTLNKATVQMAEAARDSVFRQIALRMNGEGGEMRVLLNPPELGRLDIHMIVEKGGTVHLSLTAERPELALVLEKHLGELKQALEAQGLSIGNTEIRGREKQLQDREGRGESSSGDAQPDDGEDWTAAGFRRAGYITAEGLDFWV